MNCPNDNLILFAYQELSTAEESEIQHHLTQCAECSKEIGDLTALDRALPSLVQEDAGLNAVESKCPDAMMLAQYRSGYLAPTERESIETHLSRCRPCLDELMAADELLESAKAKKLATPGHLMEQTIRMELHAPAVKQSVGLLIQLRDWLGSLMAAPRWALAGAGACAVVLLAVFFTREAHRDGLRPEQALRHVELNDSGRAQPKTELVAEFQMDLTDDLKRALMDYDPKTNPPSEKQLLSLLQKKNAGLPVDNIRAIEIDQNLMIAIASARDLSGKVKLSLYKDGLLTISAAAK